MMGTLRSMLLLLLTTTLSHNALGRPETEEDVKIITKPSPGDEYVLIQSSKTVTPGKHPKQAERDAVKGFSTSHRIPSREASEKPLSPSLTKPENVFSTSHKITRYHTPLVKRSTDNVQTNPADESEDSNMSALLRVLSQTILTRDQVLHETETKLIPQTEEIRTEYSVVTSKPRKVVPTVKHVPVVKIEPKGDSGVIEENLEGSDVHKVMQRKQSVEQGKESKSTSPESENKSDDSLISNVEVKPVSQVGVTSPKFETKQGDISVPLQKIEAASSGKVTTTTVLPLTSTAAGLTKSNFDIIPVNLVADKTKKEHEKDLDFVDSPLGDKLLVPAGSSSNQQSRIEVKKGPNGQDYEYEYVYYYYDDEDNDTIATAGERSHVTASPPTTTSTTTESTSTSGKRYLPTGSHKDTIEEANHAAPTRGRSRNRSQSQGATEQQNQPDHLESKPSNGRQRYTTIERNKGEASTTVVPESSNEVLPPSRGSRFRGRQLSLQTTTQSPEEPTPVAEERLPANTRFPPRSRSNHNSATVTTPSSEETLANRGRSSSGNGGSAATNGVKRPSLELVDSSSFRTHSSDVSRGQDLTSQPPSFPSVLPSGPFRFLGVIPNEDSAEKEVKHRPSRVQGRGELGTVTPATVDDADTEKTSSRRGPHIRRPSTPPLPPEFEEVDELFDDETTESIPTDGIIGPVSHDARPSATELPETDSTADENTVSTTEKDTGLTAAMMDKAALDLYAIFQQTQDENASNFVDENATDSSLEEDEENENTTEEGITTTVAVSTTSTTTTTTTTTEAPTTTTTEAPTTQAVGGNRYKSRRIGHRGQNGQNKYRPNGVSTTTTTEPAPIETSSRAKGRFGNNRTPVGSGSFGRRGQHKTTSKPAEEEAVKEESKEVASTAPKNNGFPRSRFGTTRSTRVTSTTAATPEAVSTSGTHAPRPVFADRYNTRRRGGPTRATSASLSDTTKADTSSTEDNSEPAAASEPSVSTPKTTGRSRLNIGGGPRPLRPGPKINIGGRLRPGAAPTSVATTQTAPTEPDQEGNEQASHPTTDDDTQPEAQEPQETVTTPIPDALTRLRSRPRLHVTGAVKTTSAPAANSNNRRHLVSSLLPKRRPIHPAPETKDSEAAEPHDSDATAESESPAKQSGSEETQETVEGTATSVNEETHDAPRENRLSSLLSGRRRATAARRPGTLLPSAGKQSSQDAA